MKTSVFLGALAAAGFAAGAAGAATLDDVKAKGFLQCGVSTGVPGFAYTDDAGEWQGFDVGVCRAVAAAVFGDPSAVKFTPTTGKTRFTALASGEVDMLARNTTWTFSRDVDLKFDLRRRELLRRSGLHGPERSGRELGQGPRRRHRLHPDRHHHRAEPGGFLPRRTTSATSRCRLKPTRKPRQQYLAGACDVYTTDASGLAATRATFEDPRCDHVDPAGDHLERAARPAGASWR